MLCRENIIKPVRLTWRVNVHKGIILQISSLQTESYRVMSDEKTTQEKLDARSFEDRVFARFDALDARINMLERKVDERAVETKPIWERALTEIAETRAEMRRGVEQIREDMNTALRKVERKIDVLNQNILNVQADQRELDSRVENLEKAPAS